VAINTNYNPCQEPKQTTHNRNPETKKEKLCLVQSTVQPTCNHKNCKKLL